MFAIVVENLPLFVILKAKPEGSQDSSVANSLFVQAPVLSEA